MESVGRTGGTAFAGNGIIMATEKYLSGIDAKADALKSKILDSKTRVSIAGTAYYVSNMGNDLNDGKTEKSAWATLDMVNKAAFKDGDAVFFERGGTWRGNITAKAGVTYSAFGKGAKPVLIGSLKNYSIKGQWIETAVKNIYSYNEALAKDAGVIVFNGGEAYTYKKIKGVEGFTGEPEELKNDLEMYHSKDNGIIYLYSDKGNPADRFASIEFCLEGSVIKVTGDNVTIDNLCLKYCGYGITSGTRNGLTVTYCEIGWMGGYTRAGSSTTRYGNAIEIYGGCKDYFVDHCYIYQIYDAAITHQFKQAESSKTVIMENVTYSNNLIEYCIYSIEYFLDQPKSPDDVMKNILFKDNICRFAGYGFGWQRPNKVARHIQGGWLGSKRKYPAENYVIEGNIFDRSIDTLISIAALDAAHLPVMKNNTYIQYAGGRFGYYGIEYAKYIDFDENVTKFIMEIMNETKPGIVLVLPE